MSENTANDIYREIAANFDSQRITDGKVVIIIDDISKEIKKYLLDMKRIQSISKKEILNLAAQFEYEEDRAKCLRIIYEEYRREYQSDIE
jgi:hypothetical protein